MRKTSDSSLQTKKEVYTTVSTSTINKYVIHPIHVESRFLSRSDVEMSPTHLSKSLVRHSHRSPIRSFKTPEGMRKTKDQFNSADRLTVAETFAIDRENKYSKSSKKFKKKPTKLNHSAQLPPMKSIANKLLKENYVDVHQQAERISTSQRPTIETLVNVRYSHIPVDPGVPMGYSKVEPTFRHYKEINEQMLHAPRISQIVTTATSDSQGNQKLADQRRTVDYSNLRYAVEDVQLSFNNDLNSKSKDTMRQRLSSIFQSQIKKQKYDTSRLSAAPSQTKVLGKVLSSLQNSRIEESKVLK